MIRWALPLTTSRQVSTPLAVERVELGQQHAGVDHHPVADDRRDVVVEDAARHQLEGEGLAVDHDGVAGVVAALVADDHLHLLGQEVGELALALVAPLGPDDDGCGHASLLRRKARITHQCSPAGRGSAPGCQARATRPTAPSVGHVHGDRVAVGVAALEQGQGQRVLDLTAGCTRRSGRAPKSGS